MPYLSFDKFSNLMRNELYTVVRSDADISKGVFPEDQGLSGNRIFLWDNYKDLIVFDTSDMIKLKVIIPDQVKHRQLLKCVGATYSLPYLKNTWPIEEMLHTPVYAE